MVDLIRKFQKIHDKNIVHNDIKPANIMMKNNDFSDLRVVDFGFALKVNSISVSGTPYYFAPERHTDFSVSYKGDIYSLALTFATLEKSGMEGLKGMGSHCFLKPPSEDCKQQLEEVIKEAFSQKHKTEFLFEVFKIAANPDPKIRYSSMKNFADAIVEASKNIIDFEIKPEEKNEVVPQLNIKPQETNNINKYVNSKSQDTQHPIPKININFVPPKGAVNQVRSKPKGQPNTNDAKYSPYFAHQKKNNNNVPLKGKNHKRNIII